MRSQYSDWSKIDSNHFLEKNTSRSLVGILSSYWTMVSNMAKINGQKCWLIKPPSLAKNRRSFLTFISGAGKFAVCCWNWLNWSIQLIWDWLGEKLWLIIGELTASFDGSKGDGTAVGDVIWLVAGKSKTVDWLLSKFSFFISIIGEIEPDDPPNSEQFIKTFLKCHIYKSFYWVINYHFTLLIVVTPHENLHEQRW